MVLRDWGMRALDENTPIRLPYPIVALEFSSDSAQLDDHPNRVQSFIIFAREWDDCIAIDQAYKYKSDGTWGFGPSATIPRTGYVNRSLMIPGGGIPILMKSDWQGEKTALKMMATRLLGFLNALACSNVRAERSPADRQPKRAGNGVLPFDDYHVLTISVAGRAQRDGVADGSHRSPREHLRRGHIRRLQDGRKLWVNATVVNPGVGGKVTKDYRLEAAPA